MDILEYIDKHFVWFVSHLMIILFIVGLLLWNMFCKVRKLRNQIKKLEKQNANRLSIGLKTKINRDIARLKRKDLNNELDIK